MYSEVKDPIQIERYFQVFFNYVQLLVDIPESDQMYCRRFFKPIYVKKNTILESADTVHNYHNFIVSGFMRNYYQDEEANEITTNISDGPQFFTSYHHFIQRTVSNEYIHCITDCELLRITRDDVDITAQVGVTQKDYSLKILEQYLESSKQRILDLSRLTAKQRYVKLLQHHPAIIQHVPLTYIASYLGINAGSLSRIRKDLS